MRYVSAKIFKVFPRGGALAKTRDRKVIFLSWFDKGPAYIGKIAYMYPEDVEEAEKGQRSEKYFFERPTVSRADFRREPKKVRVRCTKSIDISSEGMFLRKIIRTEIDTQKLGLAYKCVDFSHWDEVETDEYSNEIVLRKKCSIPVSPEAQAIIEKMMAEIDTLPDSFKYYKDSKVEQIEYLIDYRINSVRCSLAEYLAEVYATDFKDALKKWAEEVAKEEEEASKEQQMYQEFADYAAQVKSIEDLILY